MANGNPRWQASCWAPTRRRRTLRQESFRCRLVRVCVCACVCICVYLCVCICVCACVEQCVFSTSTCSASAQSSSPWQNQRGKPWQPQTWKMWQRSFATEGLKGEYTLMVPRENSRIAGLEWFTINLNFLLRSDACKKKYNCLCDLPGWK